ncbi:hypothetical protein LU631_21795 [Erwinia tracheiphila]|uniref:hypothetical protein n=1 Tax=Erwinia tracheiphila TaxID=65700 RepID=UPI00128C2D57|nr:hypothetical protein [Erwinia tracheiphila]UIA87328.1 hypothetical protein LU631_21795 [Erwinia tracheiphila]UIA95692.1 hypothetical protein LU633_20240 [Erwinia tracheiphila]
MARSALHHVQRARGSMAARPAPGGGVLCGSVAGRASIKHNVGGLRETGRRSGPQRVTRIMSAPFSAGRFAC